jgi:hypothetical protein
VGYVAIVGGELPCRPFVAPVLGWWENSIKKWDGFATTPSSINPNSNQS